MTRTFFLIHPASAVMGEDWLRQAEMTGASDEHGSGQESRATFDQEEPRRRVRFSLFST